MFFVFNCPPRSIYPSWSCSASRLATDLTRSFASSCASLLSEVGLFHLLSWGNHPPSLTWPHSPHTPAQLHRCSMFWTGSLGIHKQQPDHLIWTPRGKQDEATGRCVSLGPLRSRWKGRIKSARILLEEVPVKENEKGAWKGWEAIRIWCESD